MSAETSHLTPDALPFIVFPAIDLHDGQVVRLAQGDPARQTVYAHEPAVMARRFVSEGADWLHVVNLDGAFGKDTGANETALSEILSIGIKVQLGGGLRDEAALSRALDCGVSRAILGTAAVENLALVDWAVRELGPERIAVGIDARGGQVRIKGWTEGAATTATALGRRVRAAGVAWCIFTDVARDGVGSGVNVAASVGLARETGLRVIASGGVNEVGDVRRARQAGLAGIIIGRALYEGRIALKEVLE